MQAHWGALALGALGAAALLAGLLPALQGPAGAAEDELALPAAPATATGALKQFDATAREAGCLTTGQGRAAGSIDGQYDPATRSARYTIALTGAPPNTDFLLDISECCAGGERLARGDGGHLRTDGQGSGRLEGSWALQTEARRVRASLVAYCDAGAGLAPILPCGSAAFASDALLLPAP